MAVWNVHACATFSSTELSYIQMKRDIGMTCQKVHKQGRILSQKSKLVVNYEAIWIYTCKWTFTLCDPQVETKVSANTSFGLGGVATVGWTDMEASCTCLKSTIENWDVMHRLKRRDLRQCGCARSLVPIYLDDLLLWNLTTSPWYLSSIENNYNMPWILRFCLRLASTIILLNMFLESCCIQGESEKELQEKVAWKLMWITMSSILATTH